MELAAGLGLIGNKLLGFGVRVGEQTPLAKLDLANTDAWWTSPFLDNGPPLINTKTGHVTRRTRIPTFSYAPALTQRTHLVVVVPNQLFLPLHATRPRISAVTAGM